MTNRINANTKKIIVAVLVVIILFFGFKQIIGAKKNDSFRSSAASSTSSSDKPLATVEINRPYEFTVSAVAGLKKDEKVKFTILSAERKDQVTVKGEKTLAPAGKNFLLLRLELGNDSTERVPFISPDYVRLVGEDNKKFAPDYHNGRVILEPISVRRDLMAFIIDNKTKKFTLSVGELEKAKEQFDIEFK